jgi:hypothetical protein
MFSCGSQPRHRGCGGTDDGPEKPIESVEQAESSARQPSDAAPIRTRHRLADGLEGPYGVELLAAASLVLHMGGGTGDVASEFRLELLKRKAR